MAGPYKPVGIDSDSLFPPRVEARLANAYADKDLALLGNRWVFDGDSITIGGTGGTVGLQDHGPTWVSEMARSSDGRILYTYNTGVGGQRLDQALTRFDTWVAPYAPEVVMLTIGTNDISQGRTLAAFLADLETYRAKCMSIGADLVLGGIYPKSATQGTIAQWNIAVSEWARSLGILHVPFWELGNPATGAWPAGWSSDGTHLLDDAEAICITGRFAWDFVADRVRQSPLVRPPYQNAAGWLSAELGATLTSANTAVVTITSLTATTGTLPTGTYEYRVTASNLFGQNGIFDDDTITLGANGGVTVTKSSSGSYNRWRVFRKGPGDTAFKFVATIPSTTDSWVDDGSVTPGFEWADGDMSRVPVGLVNGSGADMSNKYGPLVQTDPSVRGNILRFQQYLEGTSQPNTHFLVTGLTAGETFEVSCRVRGLISGNQRIQVPLRWRDANGFTGATHMLVKQWIDLQWGTLYLRGEVPAGADRVRISFEHGGATGVEYLDVAEVGYRTV